MATAAELREMERTGNKFEKEKAAALLAESDDEEEELEEAGEAPAGEAAAEEQDGAAPVPDAAAGDAAGDPVDGAAPLAALANTGGGADEPAVDELADAAAAAEHRAAAEGAVDFDTVEAVDGVEMDEERMKLTAEDWLQQYRDMKTGWSGTYGPDAPPRAADAVEPEGPSEEDLAYDKLLQKRKDFYENERRAAAWRVIDTEMQVAGPAELLWVLNDAVTTGPPTPVEPTLYFDLARKAVRHLQDVARSEYGTHPDETGPESIVVAGGIPIICAAAEVGDMVVGPEAVRLLCLMAAEDKMRVPMLAQGAVQVLVNVASFPEYKLPPSKLLNLTREAGAALRSFASDPSCQISLARMYPLSQLAKVAHCNDAVRRMYAAETVKSLLSNNHCTLTMMQQPGGFKAVAPLCHSPYAELAQGTCAAIRPLLEGGLLIRYLTTGEDMLLLLGLANHKQQLMQECALKTLSLISARRGAVNKALIDVGAVATLLAIVCDPAGRAPIPRRQAARTLQNISFDAPGVQSLVARGFLSLAPVKGAFLQDTDPVVRLVTVKCLQNVAHYVEYHKPLLAKVLPGLCEMIRKNRAAPDEEKEVVKLLGRLVDFDATHESLCVDGAVHALADVATGPSSITAQDALETLLVLSDDAASHFIMSEVKLAERVCDAYRKEGPINREDELVDNENAAELLNVLDPTKEIRSAKRKQTGSGGFLCF